MKRLLTLILFTFLLAEGNAQNDDVSSKAKEYQRQNLLNRIKEWKVAKDSNIVRQNLDFLKGKPGVYRLPQDNMPCIVPDSNKTVRIPNVWKGPKRVPYKGNPPRIPNLTKPWVPTPINLSKENENADTK